MISTRGRYALKVMIDLAQNQGDGYVPMKDVAARQGLSLKYLEQILPTLTKNKLVEGLQGKGGGYRLKKAALTDEQLQTLFTYAKSLHLEVLVEVHDVEELQRAMAIGAKIIGVNNRNLKTFEVSLKNTLEIAQHLPSSDIAFISESGIWNEEDAQYVAMAGAKGVLVGESLMRSGDVENSLKSLQIDITTKVGENR